MLNKYYLLASLLMLVFAIKAQQSEIIIEVKTDSYPNESSWKLFSLNGDLRAQSSTFLSDAYNYDTILVGTDSCFYWTLFDTYGDGLTGDAINGEPGYAIFLDGEKIIENISPDFGKKISEFGIGHSCAISEVAIDQITTPSTIDMAEMYFSVQIVNMGREIINDVALCYTLADFISDTLVVDAKELAPGESRIIEHPQMFQFTQSGTANLSMMITHANGESDNMDNNNAEKPLTIVDGYLKKPLFEVFTSSTCPPCAAANQQIDNTLENFEGNYSLVKYQVNWPGNGDPYTIYDCALRAAYYNVSGAPSLYVNGNGYSPMQVDDSYVSGLLQNTTSAKIYANGALYGDSVLVHASVNVLEGHDPNWVMHALVAEKKTHNNASSNGETEFNHVLMDMIPDANGTALTYITADQKQYFAFGTSLSGTFVEEPEDLLIVLFIQNKSTYEIIQSETFTLPAFDHAPILAYNISEGDTSVLLNSKIQVFSKDELRNIDNNDLEDLSAHISIKDDNTGTEISFSATLSEHKKQITILPDQLESFSNYTLQIQNVENIHNQAVVNTVLHFRTSDMLRVNSTKATALTIYPNPAQNMVFIELQEAANIEICTMLGNIIYNSSQATTSYPLDISMWKAGIYLVRTNKNTVQKLIIQ